MTSVKEKKYVGKQLSNLVKEKTISECVDIYLRFRITFNSKFQAAKHIFDVWGIFCRLQKKVRYKSIVERLVDIDSDIEISLGLSWRSFEVAQKCVLVNLKLE